MEAFPVAPGVMVNVDRARAIVRGRKPNHRVFLPEVARMLTNREASTKFSHIRKSMIKLGEPVLLVPVAGRPVLVDGWHRSRYAFQRGRRWLPGHLLTEAEFRRVVLMSKQFRKTGKRK
jgi:hypothetical protein